jgi:FHS family glucose/mannose:H+ symporter-like MFS transporter
MKTVSSENQSSPELYPSGWLLCLGFALTGMAVTLLGPILPAVMQRWHLKDSQAGLLLSAQFLGCFAGSVLVTRHLRRALLLGAAALTIGWLAFACELVSEHGLWTAPVTLLIAGFGAGHLMSATNLVVGRTYQERRGSGLSLFNAFWSVGAILSSLAIGNLVLRFSLVGALMGFAGCSFFVLAGLLFQILRSRRAGDALKQHGPEDSPAIGAEPDGILLNQWLAFGAMFFLYGGVEASVNAWITTYTVRHSNSTLWLGEASVGAFWIAITAGRAVAAGVLRFVNERLMQRVCLVGAVLSLGMVLLARSGGEIVGAALLTGLFLAPIFPSLCAMLMGRGARPRQVGWALALTGLGATVLPSLTGFVSTRTASLGEGLVISIVSALVLFVLSILLPRTSPR